MATSVVAASVAGGTGDGAEEPPRDYFWWQCQTLCRPKEYTMVLKGSLRQLYIFTLKAITTSGETPKEIATLTSWLNMIFHDKMVTMKSYNLKALQCCLLMTYLRINSIPPDNYELYQKRSALIGTGGNVTRELNELYRARTKEGMPIWLFMDQLEAFIRGRKSSVFEPLLVEEGGAAAGGGSCCPIGPGSVIPTILGTMTFMELLESLNDDIYYLGIVDDFTMADGYEYSPVEFFAHDLFHRRARLGSLASMGEEVSGKVKANVRKFLTFIRTIPDERKRYLGEMVLFMIQHEAYTDKRLAMDGPPSGEAPASLTLPLGWKEGLPVAWDITSWTSERYGPLIPKEEPINRKKAEEVYAFLSHACEVFKELWDTAMAQEALPERPPGRNYSESAASNAAAWNALAVGGRRTLRKSRKRKTRSLK
jgi:hypothetical protein